MKDTDRICTRLRKARLDQGMTLQEVEDRSGISSSSVALIEERRHAFSLDELKKLAAAYQVPLNCFFEDAEGAASEGVRQAPSDAEGGREKVSVTIVKMAENSEASWRPPASGKLYVYLVSGRAEVSPAGAEALLLDERGFCRCETTRAARVRALKPSCFYLTCVRE